MRWGGESQEDDEVIPELRPHSVGLADRIASGNMVGARQEGETWVGPMTLAKASPPDRGLGARRLRCLLEPT